MGIGAISTARAKQIVAQSKRDPVWFSNNVLGCKPHAVQQEIQYSVRDHKETAVASCHGAGKSFIAGQTVLWFLYSHRPSIVITTAPTARQVRGILWKEIRTAHRRSVVPLGGRALTQSIELAPNWFAIGFTVQEHDPDRFKGYHEENILVVADEAAAIGDEIFIAVDGVLTTPNARLLMIGNPTVETGRFARTIDFGAFDSNVIHVSAFDLPNLREPGVTIEDIRSGDWEAKVDGYVPEYPGLTTAAWVRGMYENWGEESPQWDALVMGKIPHQREDSVYFRRWIEAAAAEPYAEDKESGPVEIGIDPAGPGEDETAAYARCGDSILGLFADRKADARGMLVHWMGQWRDRIKIVRVDASGEGRAYARHLQDLEFPVLEVAFAEVPKGKTSSDQRRARDEYADLKAQLHWWLRLRMEAGELRGLTDQDTARQLRSLRWTANSRGRIEIESKSSRARRGLKSPDRAEALMLAFAEVDRKRVPNLKPSYW